MITYSEIQNAINKKVENALLNIFEYTVPLVAEDISEPIIRPSVKVIFENSESGRFNEQCKERTLTYNVYFFAKNRHKPKPENIAVREALENEFIDELQVTDTFFIPIETVDFEVSDGVLIMTVELYTIELLPDVDTSENMEDINLNI